MENGKQKAHPFINKNGDAEQGLTKREYFAGLAMQGLLATNHKYGPNYNYNTTSIDAVKFADALLKELDKSKSE